jgi:hypothetical protein
MHSSATVGSRAKGQEGQKSDAPDRLSHRGTYEDNKAIIQKGT